MTPDTKSDKAEAKAEAPKQDASAEPLVNPDDIRRDASSGPGTGEGPVPGYPADPGNAVDQRSADQKAADARDGAAAAAANPAPQTHDVGPGQGTDGDRYVTV